MFKKFYNTEDILKQLECRISYNFSEIQNLIDDNSKTMFRMLNLLDIVKMTKNDKD